MPTYDYQCEKCGYTFEHFQSISADPLETCPKEKCGGKVKRLLSGGGGVIFKGKGFHSTDYRAKSPCEAAGSGACPNAGTCPAAGGGD